MPGRKKIYTKAFTGRFRNLRRAGGLLLFALFYGIVWLRFNGRPLIQFDLPAREFYIFGQVFWPQDFFLLALLLMISAFSLFAITVFAGRVWCGYTCPQSVYTWVFMWAEKLMEGDRNARIRRDRGPLTLERFGRKMGKHLIWLAIAFATGLTFVGYFTPIRELIPAFFEGIAHPAAYFWVMFFTVATFVNAGYAREKVCLHMCPYARFQAVMFDSNTLVVAYDAERGEPRGPRKRNIDPKAQDKGDCIDCNMCVHVCPTGIDIRNGLQYECITCAACVDACDSIMEKMGYARGLVSYTSENHLKGQGERLLRPRLVGYVTVIALLGSLLISMTLNRSLTQLDVLRGRGQLYRYAGQGQIENAYRLRIVNKDQVARQYKISVSGSDDLSIIGRDSIRVLAGEVADMPVRVMMPLDAMPSRKFDFSFHIRSIDRPLTEDDEVTTFIGPAR
jgi:cytochrome c oxidase accessory protein FixG